MTRVLVVDDEPLLAATVREMLEGSGYQVTLVHDGPSALAAAQSRAPDIVLLDLIMPGMTGLAVCAELRRMASTRRTPIVMLTAASDEDNVTRAFAAGADDYITKPVRKYELLPRLGAHLRSKRLFDELEAQTRDRHLLLELSNTLASRLDMRQILRTVASKLVEAIAVERCSVILLEPGRDDVGVVVAASEDPGVYDLRLQLENYPEIQEVLQTRSPLVVPDAEAHPLFSPVKSTFPAKAVRASILFPMMVMNEVVGVMLLRSAQPIDALSSRELTFGQTVASAAAIAVRNARLFSGIAEEQVRLDVERREASERLEVVQRFEDFIASAADGMVTMDEHGTITFANATAAALLGVPAGSALNLAFLSLVEAEARPRVKAVISSVVHAEEGSAPPFDVPVIVRGGRHILSVTVSRFLRRHGATLFSFRDITQERLNEAELKKTKDFLQNIINASVDPIVAWGPDGNVVLLSQAAQDVTGYTESALLDGLSAAQIFGAAGLDELVRDLRSPQRGGVGKLELSRREIIARSGEVIPVNCTAAVVTDGGEEIAFVGVFSDMRERLRIESKLSAAQEKLQLSEKQSMIAELAGTAAHELNQPLTSIVGYCELLRRKVADDQALLRPIEVIEREAQRMAEIVRKVGRITKYETKAYVGNTRIVDLDASVAASEETPPK